MRTVLPLEESLENNPQNRALVHLAEDAAANQLAESSAIEAALRSVVSASAAMGTALSALAGVLVGQDRDEEAAERRIGAAVEETAGSFGLLAQQLTNCVLQPVSKLSQDLNQLSDMSKPAYHAADETLREALSRYCKLGRKESPKRLQEANDEVYEAKKSFHHAAVAYFAGLNSLEPKRERWLVEPMLGLLYAFRAFAASAADALKTPKMNDFLGAAQARIQGVHKDFKAEQSSNRDIIDNIEQLGDSEMYYAEPPMDLVNPVPLPNQPKSHMQGYLHLKVKGGLGWHWSEAEFFFTAGQMLMRMGRDEVGGAPLLDVSEALGTNSAGQAFGIVAALASSEERRNTFSVTLPPAPSDSPAKKGKPRTWTFQAVSGREAVEWVETLNQLARDPDGLMMGSRPMAIPTREPLTPQSTPADPGMMEAALPSQPIQFDLLEEEEATEDASPESVPKWTVRFMGSMEVHSDTGDSIVVDTIRQVMSARARHSMFSAAERTLAVDATSAAALWLQDADGKRRLKVPLTELAHWAPHPDNAKLLGLITRQRPSEGSGGRARFVCHVLDADVPATEICAGLGKATQEAFQQLVSRRASQSDEGKKSDEPEETK